MKTKHLVSALVSILAALQGCADTCDPSVVGALCTIVGA